MSAPAPITPAPTPNHTKLGADARQQHDKASLTTQLAVADDDGPGGVVGRRLQ